MTSAFNGVSSTYQTMTLGSVVRAAQRRAILHQLHLTSMAYRNPSAMDGDPTQMHSPRKCQCGHSFPCIDFRSRSPVWTLRCCAQVVKHRIACEEATAAVHDSRINSREAHLPAVEAFPVARDAVERNRNLAPVRNTGACTGSPKRWNKSGLPLRRSMD